MTTIYTIGHGRGEEEPFHATLAAVGNPMLVDVRRNPVSTRAPWATCQFLRASYAGGYRHEARLGGLRSTLMQVEVAGLTPAVLRAFAANAIVYTGTRDAVTDLLGAEEPLCLLCAETDWRTCHRRVIADWLTARGCEVRHLRAGSDGWEPHEMHKAAVVEGTGDTARVTYPARARR